MSGLEWRKDREKEIVQIYTGRERANSTHARGRGTKPTTLLPAVVFSSKAWRKTKKVTTTAFWLKRHGASSFLGV